MHLQSLTIYCSSDVVTQAHSSERCQLSTSAWPSVYERAKTCGLISAQCGQSVTAAMRTGGSGIGWGISIKGVWTAGVSIKHGHHRRGCFLLVKVYRKSGDGAALSPVAPHHKSHFPVPRHKNLVSLISHPAIGDFEHSTFISSLAEIKPGFETPTLWNSAFNTGTSRKFFTAPAERKGGERIMVLWTCIDRWGMISGTFWNNFMQRLVRWLTPQQSGVDG